MERIESVQNAKVKQWVKLKSKKGRTSEKAFLIEGIHLVEEALKANAQLETIIIQEEYRFKFDSILTHVDAPICLVSSSVMERLTETETPQGICAVVKAKRNNLADLLAGEPFILVLDAVQDPGNLGTIIRTADSAGVRGVILGKGTVDVYNAKVIRSTMGSIFHLPIVEGDLGEILSQLKEARFRLIATSLHDSEPYDQPLYGGPVALLIGNEANGVSEQWLQMCDRRVKIPIYGKAESLNAAIAAGIMVYEIVRQRK